MPVIIKERPILFTCPMVRAILQSAKTVTRRLRGLDAVNDLLSRGTVPRYSGIDDESGRHVFSLLEDYAVKCPYGRAGDRLWVKETWTEFEVDDVQGTKVFYKADDPDPIINARWKVSRWTPSIHMPRWASRVNLQTTAITAERLQRIDNPQAIAEGIYDGGHRGSRGYTWENGFDGKRYINPREAFKGLWNGINGDGATGWDANPFVWVIQFRMVK